MKLIHVAGIQRTGQHAITSWIIGHYQKVGYRNDTSPSGFVKPFWYFETSKKETWDVSKKIDLNQDAWIIGSEHVKSKISLHPKLIDQLTDNGFSMDSRILLKVMRNPYNQYASVLNWRYNKILGRVKTFRDTWIAMAKANEVNYGIAPRLVKFDDWFSDINYRKDLSKYIGAEFTDKRLNTVMKIGHNRSWGSSFDGMKQNGKAQKMNIDKRWKDRFDDPRFQEVWNDKELEETANEIGFYKPE